jgi:hypothetical protein
MDQRESKSGENCKGYFTVCDHSTSCIYYGDEIKKYEMIEVWSMHRLDEK